MDDNGWIFDKLIRDLVERNKRSIFRVMLRRIFLTIVIIGNLQLVHAQSPSYDMELGKRGSEQVEVVTGVYEDEELNAYLDEIGERLVDQLADNPFEYQFKILDDPIPNAFALPGGYVYVTRGLLALVNNVDELACVISHEVIHVQKRHSIRQMKKRIFPALLQIPGMVVGAFAGAEVGNIINAPLAVGSSFFLSKYSRKHETEADDLGVQLAARAGFDPNALGPILERISRWEALRTDEEEKKDYFSTHPYTPDRVAHIDESVRGIRWQDNEMHQRSFMEALSGLTFDENPDKGVFVDSLFLHPVIDFSVVFPTGYEYVNQYNAVGAMKKDEESFLVLTLEDTSKTPEEYGVDFLERVKQSSSPVAIKGEEVKVNKHKAFLVSAKKESETGVSYSYYLWIGMGDQLYKITGVNPKEFKEEVKKVALSLHRLSDKEKGLLKKQAIDLIAWEEGESIQDVVDKSKTMLDAESLSSLNGVNGKAKAENKQILKVVKSYAYFD